MRGSRGDLARLVPVSAAAQHVPNEHIEQKIARQLRVTRQAGLQA